MRSLRDPPTPLKNLKPDVDPSLATLLERCLAKEPEKRPSAAFVSKALREGGANEQATAGAGESLGETNVLESLLKRRLPQTVVVTGAAGLAGLYFIAMLADVLDKPIFQAGLATFVCSLLASVVIAWFHGEKGPQRVTPLEVVLLAVIGIIWIALLGVVFIW